MIVVFKNQKWNQEDQRFIMIIKIEAGRITSLGLLSKMELVMSKAYNYHNNMDARKFKICGIIFNGARRARNL